MSTLSLTEKLALEEEFFSQQFLMSYSGLNKLHYSPGAFYQHYILKQRDDVMEKGMVEGKLIHCMLLTPEKFDDEFIVLPSAFPSDNPKRVIERIKAHITEVFPDIKSTAHFLPYMDHIHDAGLDILKDENLYQSLKTDAQRLEKIFTEKNMEYLEFLFKSNGKTIVDSSMLEFAQNMREEIMSKSYIREVMGFNNVTDEEVFNELDVVSIDGTYTFGLKGIIDNLVVDHNRKVIRVNDLKKSSKALGNFHESLEYYRYWIQAAIYIKIIDNIKKTTFNVDYPVEFRFIVIDPYMQVAPVKISESTATKFIEMTEDLLTVAETHFKLRDFSLPASALLSKDKEMII